MKVFVAIILFLLLRVSPIERRDPLAFSISKSELKNRIKGGWAGQVIGVAFANSRMINPNPLSALQKGFVEDAFRNNPKVFDDVYLELRFLEVIEKNGHDATSLLFAKSYTEGSCSFSHANQLARHNFLHGIKPPHSGHWTNNPHADDPDFQMQADFIGLMSPGLPAAVSTYSDKIGHIMNSGDGYYAGLYVATLYSLSFQQKSIDKIINESIATIPVRTKFHDCITQAIELHHQFPTDWRRAKLELLSDWSTGIKCPSTPVDNNVDARLTAAFLTLSLLYGELNFSRTLEIAASLCRSTDTHIASAGGILGARIGYSKIPDAWKEGLETIESQDVTYTTTSLEEAYATSFKHALRNIERNGGKIKSAEVLIAMQKPVVAPVERSFESHHVSEIRSFENQVITREFDFGFEGIGFLLKGDAFSSDAYSDFSFNAGVYIDNRLVETIDLPVAASGKRSELFWRYQLPHGHHKVRIQVLNPSEENELRVTELVVYDVNEVTLSRLPR